MLSYYDLVDRIVVSYDADGRGWTGVPIDVEQCLRRLRAIDRAGKFDYRPGHFARSEFFARPIENDTNQRRIALDQASDGADWVLQLDTDEVVGNVRTLAACLGEAETRGRSAFDFPQSGCTAASLNGGTWSGANGDGAIAQGIRGRLRSNRAAGWWEGRIGSAAVISMWISRRGAAPLGSPPVSLSIGLSHRKEQSGTFQWFAMKRGSRASSKRGVALAIGIGIPRYAAGFAQKHRCFGHLQASLSGQSRATTPFRTDSTDSPVFDF